MGEFTEDMSTHDILAHLVARDVAWGFELARSLGFAVPRDFDVGLSVIDTRPEGRGWRRRYRLRVNDVTTVISVLSPDLEGRMRPTEIARMWNALIERVSSEARVMVHHWLAKHPEAAKNLDALVALAKLDLATKNDADMARMCAAATAAMQSSTYKRVGP